MSATTIDEVIERLGAIVEQSIRDGSRLGYFASLYNRVTITVRDGVRAGRFEDGPRMARLDVVFANRYLDAYDAYQRGEPPSRSWLAAFAAARDPALTVIQHLMLGMNAHIHLDLGIAAARTCPGAAIDGLERDFDAINGVLASLVPTVEGELGQISHRFSLLERAAHGLDRGVVNFSMTRARDDAWRFARNLAALSATQQAEAIARRDRETELLADTIREGGVVALALGPRDASGVADHIRVLATGEGVKLAAASAPSLAPA
jgi:hypothetical protein